MFKNPESSLFILVCQRHNKMMLHSNISEASNFKQEEDLCQWTFQLFSPVQLVTAAVGTFAAYMMTGKRKYRKTDEEKAGKAVQAVGDIVESISSMMG